MKRSITKLTLSALSEAWSVTWDSETAGRVSAWEMISLTSDGQHVLLAGNSEGSDQSEFNFKRRDNQAAIETYVSQIIRASGKRNVDGRRLGGTPLGDAAVETIAAAKSGDKAAANAGVKKIVALTKLTKIAPLGTKDNPFTGGVSFSSLSGTTGTPGSW